MRQHFDNVRSLISGDGCSSSPELWFHEACIEHDKDYTLHSDENGEPLTRKQADDRFLKNMQSASPNWLIRFTLPYAYYFAVRIFGGSHWSAE